MNKKIAVVSSVIPQICEKLESLGYKLIYTQCVDEFIVYEQHHADMQCLKIENKIFVLSGCKNLGNNLIEEGINIVYSIDSYSEKYPENIKLNAKILGKKIIGKIDTIDSELKKYCENNDFAFINVKQGYAACSCAKVNDNSIITADNSIYNACKNANIDVLKIQEGHIKLHGAGENTYGFIGGASVKVDDMLLFFGDITKHPDYVRIKEFCAKRDVKINYLKDIELTDIGSAILLNF